MLVEFFKCHSSRKDHSTLCGSAWADCDILRIFRTNLYNANALIHSPNIRGHLKHVKYAVKICSTNFSYSAPAHHSLISTKNENIYWQNGRTKSYVFVSMDRMLLHQAWNNTYIQQQNVCYIPY